MPLPASVALDDPCSTAATCAAIDSADHKETW
jgi:hypothetical protein